MNQSQSSSAENAPAIFLFGFERSGTTLLSMMVGAHEHIAVPLTCTGMWYRYYARLGDYGSLRTRDDVERMVDDLLAEERIGLWDAEIDRAALLDGLEPGSFAAVFARFHAAYAAAKGKDIWANIEIATITRMDIANRWFANARFVHIVRDGRDVALSHRTMPYGAATISECAANWSARLDANLTMGNVFGPERYLLVRYENLVVDSETELRRICAFIGVGYSPQMLLYHTMVDGKIPDDRRWLWPNLDRPPDKSKVYRWKNEMTTTERIVFERSGNNMLRELGYDAFDEIPRSPRADLLEIWYSLRLARRIRRYARRFGITTRSKLEREWSRRSKGDGGRSNHERTQKNAFGALIAKGVYGGDFRHSDQARSFFVESMGRAVDSAKGNGRLAVLECGCGTGVWLETLRRECLAGGEFELYGFDITPGMIDIARDKLSRVAPADHFHEGDVAKQRSYEFADPTRPFDVIFAYDVVQQLPRGLQFEACAVMLDNLAEGGTAIIFDHDSNSAYGRKMARKKFLTQYLGMKLVPRYYCNAKYPPLEKFAKRIGAMPRFSAAIHVAPDGRKRALVVQALIPGVRQTGRVVREAEIHGKARSTVK